MSACQERIYYKKRSRYHPLNNDGWSGVDVDDDADDGDDDDDEDKYIIQL